MKHLLLLLFLLAVSSLWAQVPQSFNYQAVARDAGGLPISGGQISVTARILHNGTEVYAEKTNHTTASTGLFTLRVGEADPADFQAIDWVLGGYTLQVSVEGAIDIQTAAVPIVSVPYALLAHQVAEERQQLVLNGNQLSITGAGGNTVTLSATGTTLQAGAGIDITNNTIINKGDTDPTDDLTKTSVAGGDVSGVFYNLQIVASAVGPTELADNSVTSAKIADNAVGSTELANGSVTANKLNPMGAANGQVLKWNGTTWTPDNDNSSVGSGTAATSAPLVGDGSASKPIALSPGTATGQVLKWTGNIWAPAADETGSIVNADGDVSGPLSNLQLKPGVVGSTELSSMGASQEGQVIKWDDLAQQWKPGNDNSVGGNAGGDVSGIFENLKVIRIQGNPVDATAPQTGQVLKWNGSTWKPLPDETGGSNGNTYTSGTGITLTGTPPNLIINNDGVLKNTTPAAGDVGGTFTSGLSVDRIKGQPLSAATPSSGQVLKWSGTAWEPQADLTGGAGGNTYSSGTGITFTGTPPNLTINNSGDANASDDLTTSTSFGGAGSDVSGTYTNLQIATAAVGPTELADNSVISAKIADNAVGNTELANSSVTANKLNQMGATNGQVLKWNGTASAWQPQNEGGGSSQWTTDAGGIFYPNSGNGTVRVNANGMASKLVEMGPASKIFPTQSQSSTTGSLATFDQAGKAKTALWHTSSFPNSGAISVFGPNGAVNVPPVTLYANPYRNGAGEMYLTNSWGTLNGIRAIMGIDTSDSGYLFLTSPGTSGINSAGLINMGSFFKPNSVLSADLGFLAVNSTNGLRSMLSVFQEDIGYLRLFGPNNNPMVEMSGFSDTPNSGYLIMNNPTGNGVRSAEMSVDPNNHGIIALNNNNGTQNVILGFDAGGNGYVRVNGQKFFVINHPRDTTKEIWYACIEGPEAGAYERGTTTLKNGEAWIPFSEHFQEVINPGTTTVNLTPLSTDTDGLAVVEKKPTGIRVRELRGGKGNFSFDWEVKAVRKGYENYQAVRPKEAKPASKLSNSYSLSPSKRGRQTAQSALKRR